MGGFGGRLFELLGNCGVFLAVYPYSRDISDHGGQMCPVLSSPALLGSSPTVGAGIERRSRHGASVPAPATLRAAGELVVPLCLTSTTSRTDTAFLHICMYWEPVAVLCRQLDGYEAESCQRMWSGREWTTTASVPLVESVTMVDINLWVGNMWPMYDHHTKGATSQICAK